MVSWISSKADEQLFLSAVTLGEIQSGIERTRQDPTKAREVESWVNEVAVSMQVLPMDAACFREWGRIMDRKSDDVLEGAMIAATARVHSLIIATRNEADFKQFDVRILNPFRTG